jgi:hypothetical protein
MGDAPPLDEDAPDEALLAEDGRSSPTSVGRVRKRAQIGAQLARGWERGVAPPPKAPREELLLPPNALGQHVGAPAGLGR